MNEFKIMDLMNDIEYGWVDKYNHKHIDEYDNFDNDYILQSPTDLIKSKLGVCWDQVELERYYFNQTDYEIKTFFIINSNNTTHTFLIFINNNKYYWFEHSFEKYRGIHEYSSLDELLDDVKNKFINFIFAFSHSYPN